MSIVVIDQYNGEVSSVYGNSPERMDVVVLSYDDQCGTARQKAQYAAWRLMRETGGFYNRAFSDCTAAPEIILDRFDEDNLRYLLTSPKEGKAELERQKLELAFAMGYRAASAQISTFIEQDQAMRKLRGSIPQELWQRWQYLLDQQAKCFLKQCIYANGGYDASNPEEEL